MATFARKPLFFLVMIYIQRDVTVHTDNLSFFEETVYAAIRPLFPKADVQITKFRVKLVAAFGQKRTIRTSYGRLLIRQRRRRITFPLTAVDEIGILSGATAFGFPVSL